MPENQKEPKTCHECGLEDIDVCENTKAHDLQRLRAPIASVTLSAPKRQRDFFHEQWMLNSHGDAILDDATSSNVALLKTLHGIIQQEYDNLPIIKEVKK